MAEKTYTEKIFGEVHSSLSWGATLIQTRRTPTIGNRIFQTLKDAQAFADDANGTCIPGITLAVVNDTEENNGSYFVLKVAGFEDAAKGILVKNGSSYSVETLSGSVISLSGSLKTLSGDVATTIDTVSGDISTTIYALSGAVINDEQVISASLNELKGKIEALESRITAIVEGITGTTNEIVVNRSGDTIQIGFADPVNFGDVIVDNSKATTNS